MTKYARVHSSIFRGAALVCMYIRDLPSLRCPLSILRLPRKRAERFLFSTIFRRERSSRQIFSSIFLPPEASADGDCGVLERLIGESVLARLIEEMGGKFDF